MNELRVRNLLLDRYNAKFFTLVHKISRPFSGEYLSFVFSFCSFFGGHLNVVELSHAMF